MKREKETILNFSNRIYGYHISEELDRLRNDFCPSPGSFTCYTGCPIYMRYITKGLSCNGALDKHPEECRKFICNGGTNMIKTRNINDGKRQLCLTGSILTTLRSGEPATYIHNGKVARTSRVMVILEVAPTYVTFETVGSIYTVQFAKEPAGSFIAV